MKILLQSPTILHPDSPFHKKEKNVLIQNGRILEMGDKKFAADRIIDASGMFLSAGWFDLGAVSGDPGHESREDIDSLTRSAAAGGFSEVAVLPNTQPTVQTKNEVAYLSRGNDSRLVSIHAMGAVTRNTKGEELTEMIDLHDAGVIAFTDGLKPIWHTDIFLKALQYLQKFDGLLVDHPEDTWLNLFGQMHEGVVSTSLGLKGMPRIAEELAIARNLALLEYAGGRLHFSRLSTARAIEMVRSAKKRGLPVSCDVTSYQPLLEDKLLEGFDTNYKVNPPLREKSDNDTILKGLKDGTIDVICSGHYAQDEEAKNLEFDLADFGIINHQTVASQLAALSEEIPIEELIEKISLAPRRLLKLDIPQIEPEQKANLTLFDPKAAWSFDAESNVSKSRNSPWLGTKVKGRAVAVFNNGKNLIHAG
ncbi:MAG: dihydroorotase [Bacteroidetes bacterium]|nr:dihydroorotase [Bacteroidota bacterium]